MSENKAREIWNRIALALTDSQAEGANIGPTEVKAFLWNALSVYTNPATSEEEAQHAGDTLFTIFRFCVTLGAVTTDEFAEADPFSVDLGDTDYSWAVGTCKEVVTHLTQETMAKWQLVGAAASGIMTPPEDSRFADFPPFDREGLMWLFIRAYTQPERKEIELTPEALTQMLGNLVQESLNVDANVASQYLDALDVVKLGDRENALADCTLQQWNSKITRIDAFPGTGLRQPLAEG